MIPKINLTYFFLPSERPNAWVANSTLPAFMWRWPDPAGPKAPAEIGCDVRRVLKRAPDHL